MTKTTKRPYYNALDALYMMERHGVTFEPFDKNGFPHMETHYWRNGTTYDFITSVLGGYSREGLKEVKNKFYPDAAGLALLEPRVGDVVAPAMTCTEIDHEGNSKQCVIQPSIFVAEKHALAAARESRYYCQGSIPIIRRDGKPFIMPSYEE